MPERLPLHNLDQSGATTGQVATWDGTKWAPGIGGGGTSDGGREVLMASGVSFPAEPLEASSGGDWLYGTGG